MDELIRHAITKLSHLHFVSNDQARKRLIQMGESTDSIFVIGSPDIDVMLSDRLPDIAEAKHRYEINFSEYAIAIYHPVTTELCALPSNVTNVSAALEEAGLNFIVIYPNNDPGAEIILEAIARFRDNPRFKLLPSMRFEYFLTLLKHARAIVGNSSAGVREAPVYGVPTVNIGSRQLNRFNYPSIHNVADDKDEILHALRKLPESVVPSLHFGNGDSARQFIAQLRDPKLWATPCQKQFRDMGFGAEPRDGLTVGWHT
jgi:UDP-N-acetylglucosamine 2-epimerase (hydrolysing)